ncbi:hypothetical protein JG30_07300 [Bombilactobacillus mellifer]|uniref:Mub B2-like domain-containing protein n=1 Tax=Bombilactobacillus mellifer TaxID=1218492 RepID=A0A0F4LV81_9LACO|nr:BspA family leucine-rich repeat surface protein [Bombilactobacillus mellifer]KJY62515.1 hypothetical protein JG30_07300 [Bombilactobacillus mellifer]
MNQKKRIALTTTFVGLVCGFVLTQQQAAAASTNAPDPTTTSMLAPENTAAATSVKPAEPSQNDQPANQQTNSQKAVTNENSTTTQVQNPGSQSKVSTTTPTVTQPNNTNSSATPAPSQKTAAAKNTEATSLARHVHEATNQVSQPIAPTAPQATKSTNSPNNNSTTTASQDPQVETIAQGTWGTSKWEYTHQGDDYILHFHAGTLGASSQKTIIDPDSGYPQYFLGGIGASPEIFNGNKEWSDALTQIIIDPGVRANQNSSYLFGYLENLQKIVGLANLDTANVTNMSGMFKNCHNLMNLDLSNFDTANVTNMSYMFKDYQGANLDFSHLDTANVTDMSGMFEDYQGSTLDLSHFNTANVTDMSWMFAGCENLTRLDFSNFNTAKVTDMSFMFSYHFGVKNLDLSHFDTSRVTNMSYMFEKNDVLERLNLSNFDTTKVTDMTWMFDVYDLNHLILGPKTLFNTYDIGLPNVPETGAKIPGTNRVVVSPYWVATSGYQQGHKYTSNELMELTGRDQVTTYDWDSKPAFTQTTETKTKDRTIVIHQPDGNTKTEIQSVMISRTITLNADGSKTYGNWSSAQWDGYAIPEFAGYTASVSQIPAQTVDGNTEDQTIDVYYAPQEQTVEIQYLANGQIVGTQKITGYTGDTIMPNYHAPQGYEITSLTPATVTIDGTGKQIIQVQVSPKLNDSVEHKTLTRTINLHLPDGTMRVSKQTALLERQVTINAVTGEKIYGAWNTGNWKALNVPTLAGYTASQDQVAAQQVTGADSDQTVDVYYMPNN